MKSILSFFFALLCIHCLADGPRLSGNATPLPGATETYTSNWDNWSNTFETYANVTWNVQGGTVLTSNKHTITIQWNYTEGGLDAHGSIYVMEDLTGGETTMDIDIYDNTPGSSELCSGVLGAPKVFVDFGSGANPGPAITANTSYSYTTNCALVPDQYTIVNSTSNCRSGWWSIPHDHTGNTNGYFMMINGNNTRGVFYSSTVSGLTSAFRYEFSAWVANMFNNNTGANPQVRFQIYNATTGAELASSGNIDVPPTNPFAWQKIGFMVDIPPGVTSVRVEVADLQTAEFGNDMVLDDISFAPCYPPVIASFSATNQIVKAHACNSGTVVLYASWPNNIIPFANPAYKWQKANGSNWDDIPGATGLHFTQTENSPGVYWYRMYAYESTNPSQFLTSNGIVFFVQKLTVDAKTTDVYACTSNATGTLQGLARLDYADPDDYLTYNYSWSPSTNLSNPNVQGPTFSITVPAPPDNGTAQPVSYYYYTLSVTNVQYGCSGSATQTIAVRRPRKVFVPNAFTPNGDGSNDLFRPLNIDDYPGSHFQVYNRWGQLVFNSYGPTLAAYSWDGTFNGTPQDAGTFAWQVFMTGCPTRINYAGADGVSSGTVVLIR